MQKFKVSKSFGVDGISSYFLKIGMHVLAPVLSTIFNISILEGVFPSNWKVARVAPIYKEGPTENRSNYRPISVFPVVSRLLRRQSSTNLTLTSTIISCSSHINPASKPCTQF